MQSVAIIGRDWLEKGYSAVCIYYDWLEKGTVQSVPIISRDWRKGYSAVCSNHDW